MAVAKSDTILIDGHNVAGALKEFVASATVEELDATVLNSTYRVYEPGFKSGSMSASGVYDSDPTNLDEIHDILAAAFNSGSAKVVTASLGNFAVGVDCIMLDGCVVNYDLPIPLGQLIMPNANIRGTSGVGFGKFLMSELVTEETETNASVNNGAATLNGGVSHAHLHNDDATGAVVIIQHSTNNSVWVDLSTFVFGTKASGGYTFALNPSNTNTILFNGVTFTFITGSSTATDIQIKGSLALTMIEAAAVLNASVDGSVSVATYTATATGITVSYDAPGTGGNAYTLGTANGGNSTRTGATLSGGANISAVHSADSEEIAAGTTIRQYLRAVATVSGGDTFLVSAAFARR